MAGGANPASTVTPTGARSLGGYPAAPAQMAQPTGPNVFGQAAGAYNAALQTAQGAAGFRPQMVGTNFGYRPGNVSAQTAVGGIGTYMNPYTQDVIGRTAADINAAQQTAMNQLGAQATAAGAFGGSRQGVAEAQTNAAFIKQLADTSAQLRQQGFQTALGASQQDVANRMQASLANQSARARAAEFGQSTALQAALANQQAGLQGAQFGLGAAGQLSNLAQQGFGFGTQLNQQQMQQGALQQGLMQSLIDASRGQYAGFTGAPQQALTLPLAALGASNMGQQTQTQSQKPGLFNYLSLGLGLL